MGTGDESATRRGTIGTAQGRTAGNPTVWPHRHTLPDRSSARTDGAAPGGDTAVGADGHASRRFAATRTSSRGSGRIAATRAFDNTVLHV
jgi:hypothetical protein